MSLCLTVLHHIWQDNGFASKSDKHSLTEDDGLSASDINVEQFYHDMAPKPQHPIKTSDGDGAGFEPSDL